MINLQNDIYFHIGFHRTGTTFLQKFILPQYKDHAVLFLNEPYRFLSKYLIEESNSKLEEILQSKFKEIQSCLNQPNKPIIVSSEGLSGDIWTDNLDMAEKIYSVFSDGKIIICIRSQYTMIPSLYQYVYVKSGGCKSYAKYLNKIIENNKLDYYNIVTKYIDIFGEKNIKILLYEDLKNDQNSFLNDLLNFVNLPLTYKLSNDRNYKNYRYSLIVTKGVRLTNAVLTKKIIELLLNNNSNRIIKIRRFFMRFFSKLDSINRRFNLFHPMPYEEYLYCRELIYKHYKESNRKLFKMLQLDKNKYDYPL